MHDSNNLRLFKQNEIEQKLLLHSKNYNLVSRCLIQSIVQCEKVHEGEKESSGREEMPADQFHP
jgi:hypothetical protein